MFNLVSIFARLSIVLLAICSVIPVSVSGQEEALSDESLPRAVDLYRNYIENNGGRVNIQNLTTLIAYGTVEDVGGERYTFKMTKKRPDKFRYKIELRDYSAETYFDGQQGWTVFSKGNGDRELVEIEGDALLGLQNDANFDGVFSQLVGKYQFIKPVSFEEVRGHPSVRLEIDPSAGIAYHTIWLSLEHYQEMKLARHSKLGPEGELVESEIYFSEFEPVAGVYVAKRINYFVNGEPTRTVLIDRFRANAGVYDSYFERR